MRVTHRAQSAGDCVESVAGVFQLFLQWSMFTIILVLYMIYYPAHLKYAEVDIDEHDGSAPRHIKTPIRSDDWRLSVTLAAVVAVHFLLLVFVTFLLLGTTNPSSDTPLTPLVSIWATFLGVSSAILAAIQYMPQIYHTYKAKLVGALSIPMMCMQSPGAIAMVLSIALRPGTNWTSWVTFAVSGTMQATLLVMCFMWKYRQSKLGLDDFGHPKHDGDERSFEEEVAHGGEHVDGSAVPEIAATEESPLLQKGPGRTSN
ncbi:hypothetical protein HWV62_45511 [Athelia sp. TMB]|nr:hypothetical protein HWV62_45511 [Athelia sp. TMB]